MSLQPEATSRTDGPIAMWVRSVQVGPVHGLDYEGKPVTTGFFKHPVSDPVFLGRLGPEGDQQADLVHHGGLDKAVLGYAHAHYRYWEQLLGQDPGPAVMGENLTLEGLTEENAHIGDVYHIGSAVLQVSQPRVPCFKVNLRIGRSDALERVRETLCTGFYFRVLQEGFVAAGDAITLVSRPPNAISVARANWIHHRQPENWAAARQLLAAPELAESWREHLRQRLLRAGEPTE